jgi:hypothetical protein
VTVRTIFSENRRIPVSAAVALMIELLVILLAAGCTGQPDFRNNTTNDTPITIPSVLVTQPVQTQCLQTGNATPWIIINPINNHYIGDVFEINGTTNIGIDEKILIMIYGRPIPIPYPGVPVPLNGLYGLCKAQQGDCGINIWSYSANTSEFNTPDYFVRVGTENWTIENTTLFSVSMR